MRWLLVAALVACSSHPSKLDEQAYRQNLPKLVSFRLEAAGSGPQEVLRYRLAPGTIEHQTRLSIHSRELGEDGAGAAQLLDVREGFGIEIGAPGQPLLFRALDGALAGASTPLAESYLQRWRARLVGQPARVHLDARGLLQGVELDPVAPLARQPGAARDEIVQRVLAIAVPLPEEAVGLGARWQVTTLLRQGPAAVTQTATYTLLERTPERWKIRVDLARVGKPQVLVDPALPPGSVATLLLLSRSLRGDVEIDPRRPLVVGGALALAARLESRLEVPGEPAELKQRIEDSGQLSFP